MDKKSQILPYVVMISFIATLGIFYLLSMKETAVETSYIGEIQTVTLKAMQEAEKELTYIDNAARISSYQSLYELAEEGGFKENSECGEYGFQSWNNKKMECFPDYRENFKALFNENLNNFIARYSLWDNYNFDIKQNNKLRITGFAINDLEKEYYLEEEKRKISISRSYVPIKIEEINAENLKKIYNENPDLIDFIKSESNKQGIDPYIVMGVITAESSWNEMALRCEEIYEKKWKTLTDDLKCGSYLCNTKIDSPQGTFHQISCSYGYMQVMYPTAWQEGFRGEAEELYGKNSIIYGIKHLKTNLDKFKDIKDSLAAYNAGSGNVEQKKKKCGNEFEKYYSCLPFPYITGPYVKKVLVYSEIFKEAGNNGLITSYAVKEENEKKKKVGTYSINPSFKISIDYNIEEYQNAINEAKNLIKNCENKADLLNCIDKNKGRLIQDCETEKGRIVNDFVNVYKSCSESADDDCYCEMDINYEEKYEFAVDYDDDNYYIEEREFKINDVDFIAGYKVDRDKFELVNKDGNKISGNKLIILKKTKEIGNVEATTLSFAQEDENKIKTFYNKIDKPDKCRLKSQRAFKFCYNTTKRILTEDGMIEPIIKFALMFPDTKAPEALNVEALNYPNDKYKLILKWNKAEEDTMIYRIYYSEHDFKDKKISELQAQKELSIDAEEIGEIELDKCNFNGIVPCKFEKYDNKLDSDKLYYIKKTDEYTYVLDFTDEAKEYYFLVTAVDDSFNEIYDIENKNYKKNTPMNLLPPMAVDNLKVYQEGNDVKLIWVNPDKYKDGTDIEDEELKEYTIRIIESKNPLNIQDISVEEKEKTFLNMNKNDYIFFVAAVNQDGIAGDYASYPS